MGFYRPIAAFDESSERTVACPTCKARFTFCRSPTPFIDACGFESYALECHECGASLAGIVDPLDDTLLISEMAA
jgi:hypothetical protein